MWSHEPDMYPWAASSQSATGRRRGKRVVSARRDGARRRRGEAGFQNRVRGELVKFVSVERTYIMVVYAWGCVYVGNM